MAAARKGGSLALLLGKPDDEEEMDAESGGSPLAQALIDAVKGGDAAEVETAFQDMYDHCAAKGGGMEDEEAEME